MEQFKDLFLSKWPLYFGETDLPFVFFYSETPGNTTVVEKSKGRSCIICELAKVRKGESLAYTAESISCGGAKRYLGYSKEIRPNFDYFLSCGIPGELEGERYIRTPEMVHEMMENMPVVPANGRYIIFKRWDMIEPGDNPEVVIFFATPDVLSGLFTLASFDQPGGNGTIAPFGSGCSSIVHQPWFEGEKENPKAVLGMFDASARPCVPANCLSFAVPMKKFEKMISFMDESFLITESWKKVRKRIDGK
jgi:uncharacterized protein (DUF169 family)